MTIAADTPTPETPDPAPRSGAKETPMWYDPNTQHLWPHRPEPRERATRPSRRITLDLRRRLERELR